MSFLFGRVRAIKIIRRAAALILAVCMVLPLCGCSTGTDGNYRILKTFSEHEFRIGFRNDDYVRYYVEACAQTLSAEGVFHKLAMEWFGEDNMKFPENPDALESVGAIPYRSIIVGVDTNVFPMSYINAEGVYDGFDVAAVRAVCERLGWDVRFLDIDAGDAYEELSSGNIDVAWGGLALDPDNDKFTVSDPYISCSLVLVTMAGSGIRSVARLRHGTLVIDSDEMFMDIVKNDSRLMNKLDQITRVTGGMQACFASLINGSADATIAYSVSVRYFAKNY